MRWMLETALVLLEGHTCTSSEITDRRPPSSCPISIGAPTRFDPPAPAHFAARSRGFPLARCAQRGWSSCHVPCRPQRYHDLHSTFSKPKANQIRSRNRLRDQGGPAESDWIFQVTPRICSCFLAKTCKLAASRWNCCPKVCILEALPALDIFAWSISSCCKAAPEMSLGEVNNVCWDNRRQIFFLYRRLCVNHWSCRVWSTVVSCGAWMWRPIFVAFSSLHTSCTGFDKGFAASTILKAKAENWGNQTDQPVIQNQFLQL